MLWGCAGAGSSAASSETESSETESSETESSETESEAESESEAEAEAEAEAESEAEAEAEAESESESGVEWVTREVRVDTPSHDTPGGAPHAIVHGTRQAERIVLFLHGWGGCARALAFEGEVACFENGPTRDGWGITQLHSARPQELLVVAQLSWLRRSGAAGRFTEDGFAATWIDALELPALPITLVAHSAGFETALAILQHGQLDDRVDRVVLFDALYAGTEGFTDWVGGTPNRRLLSYYTGSSSTRRQNRRLRRLAATRNLSVAEALGAETIVSLHTNTRHADVPMVHWAEALDAVR